MGRAERHHLLLREWLPLLAVVSCAFVFNASEFMPVALLTGIAESFSLTASQAGMVITVCAYAGLGLIGWAGAALAALGLAYGSFVLAPRLRASRF